MFEDSTFESNGRIRTRSRGWMLAAFVFNGSILLALILIPLIYPEALPQHMLSTRLEAPVPPPVQPHVEPQTAPRARHDVSEIQDGRIFAPPRIPTNIRMVNSPEPAFDNALVGSPDLGQRGPEVPGDLFHDGRQAHVVPEQKGTIHLSSVLVEGMLLHKTLPVYPAIAKATHAEGTVVLQATISKAGAIQNLRVINGHPMLQQAALDAVSHWRYRPYLLNGVPVEVETTVNVIFKLNE